ncbi:MULTISPECIES: hypothetical protein [Apibacter]|uniref:hypothetical protein n=1 Tax=Apibacter TaxID=1778601 RepID=UPI000CF9F0C8|nr:MULTISPECIES: hypothetical protein [Apibacter]MCX8676464.1 hypothetical protein [Apibacter sp. B3919]MXO23927.1 hypothetical protein [Apibacter sp. B3924]MXO26395.1 hypothetical protein [Apibacter sp. B3813]MXO28347.1 hypothetical protein [Apibacter sp. B3913]MXO30301.1 hypothetical protein [Apibacter sp. B3912]
MFNSREYEWADFTATLGGKDLTGIRGVKYTRKIEREAVYGKGRNARAIQSGNVSIEGEITLLQSEYESLVASAKNRDILNLCLDLVGAYGNPTNGDMLIMDRITGVRFTEAGKEFKQGDKFMEITLPFIALDVISQC